MLLETLFRLDERKLHIVDALRRYKDDPAIFVTFSDVAKVGIYPQSTHDTPLGIYTYPLGAMWQHIEHNTIPFAKERPFVHVLRATGHILDVAAYGQGDFDRDLDKLGAVFLRAFDARDGEKREMMAQSWYKEPYATLDPEGREMVDGNRRHYAQTVWHNAVEHGHKTAFKQSPAGILWNVTRLLAKSNFSGRGNAPVLWNALFRALGYDGVVDRLADGLIHENEPCQAVFFSKAAVHHVATIDNIRTKALSAAEGGTVRRFASFREFFRWLGELRDDYDYEAAPSSAAVERRRVWTGILRQQWAQFRETGASPNLALDMDKTRFALDLLGGFKDVQREMLYLSPKLLPVVLSEMLRDPALQTTDNFDMVFHNLRSGGGPKDFAPLLNPAVLAALGRALGDPQKAHWRASQAVLEQLVRHLPDEALSKLEAVAKGNPAALVGVVRSMLGPMAARISSDALNEDNLSDTIRNEAEYRMPF